MQISVIGTGYVGLVTGACFAEFGVNVLCMDNDEKRIAKLEKGEVPFFEPGITELVARGLNQGRLSFTAELMRAVDHGEVIFIAVGTPPKKDGSADLSFVEEVGRGIARKMTSYKVVATKSTVPVGTGALLRKVIAASQEKKIAFDVVSNPEFLREGSAIEDFMRPNRVVIGSDSERAIELMKELYRPLYLLETPIVVTDVPTAEMIKYASNAFLATKISFINEIATLCERVGADIKEVVRGFGLDSRIGPKFLNAGVGWGGSCFGKDVSAIIDIANEYNYEPELLRSTVSVNKRQRHVPVLKLQEVLKIIKGKTIGLLGLAFKPETDDIRDAPALEIARELLDMGARVKAYDPIANEVCAKQYPDLKIEYANDAVSLAEDCDAIVIVTEWEEFQYLDLEKVGEVMNGKVLVDGRNVLDPAAVEAAGFKYRGIGR